MGKCFLVLLVAVLISTCNGINIYTFDVSSFINTLPSKDAYEQLHFLAAVGGILNRQGPTFYVYSIDIDTTWMNYVTAKDGWLEGANLITLKTYEDILTTFPTLNSAVLYDPNVPSTSLVASTIAGVDDIIPICMRNEPGSLYTRLVLTGKLKVHMSLVGMFNGSVTGSSKCDAYVWAVKNYLIRGKSDPTNMGYYIDYYWALVDNKMPNPPPWHENTVLNHDYFISKRGFFWDLDFWDDQAPNDDPNQPLGTDLKTVEMILAAANTLKPPNKMIHIGGFTPWAFKYVNIPPKNHGGVDTEWQTVKITSSYNTYLDADACCIAGMANAAFYQHFPLKQSYGQNPAPTEAEMRQLGYILPDGKVSNKTFYFFYMGDYDSAAWLYSQWKPFWDDSNRGSIPIGWALNPNLIERFPLAFDYFFKTKSPNDRLITGDSGAGYLNPTQLYSPRLPSNLPPDPQLWTSHSIPYYKKFNITFTGFVIQGFSGQMTTQAEQLYSSFSPDGMVLQTGYAPPGKPATHLVGNTPVFAETDISRSSVTDAVNTILSEYVAGVPQFKVFRAVLVSPSFLKQVVDGVTKGSNGNVVVVEPLALSLLAKKYLTTQEQ